MDSSILLTRILPNNVYLQNGLTNNNELSNDSVWYQEALPNELMNVSSDYFKKKWWS